MPCHCLDVAAVASVLLGAYPALAGHIIALGGWRPTEFNSCIVFLVALHDLGKFSRTFQAKAPERWPDVLGGFEDRAGPRHGEVGLHLLLEHGPVLSHLRHLLPGWRDADIKTLMGAVAGHHGRPVEQPLRLKPTEVCETCRGAAHAFVVDVAAMLRPVSIGAPAGSSGSSLSWWLAGFTTLCDWIGSAERWFPYRGDLIMTLEEYWRIALAQAKKAVAASGLLPVLSSGIGALETFLPFQPTPVQALAQTVTLPNGPLCVIVEDATGGGKTEAALLLAHRLIAEGRADGLFLALPTMATADAMFDRLATSYRRLFAANARPSLALAHGRAMLNDLFQGSILAATDAVEDEAGDGETTASAQCAAWLAEERRRVFLAHVGVGTIDQALLGVLAARYAALRLFGLSRKVLVVDEAHSYDPYMAEELDRLLMFHASFGGSSIVLSATLPQSRRATLLKAVAAGLETAPHAPALASYPLVTVAGGAGSAEHHRPMREELRRDLCVRRLGSVAEAGSAIAGAARDGACCIWVRNTVDDALAAAAALRNEGVTPIVFHARFAMGDRLAIQKNVLSWFGKSGADRAPAGVGRVLVATQVVEQSLDLDADMMVTDLAPIELLIQRAGRLHRHPDRLRPAGFMQPELLVVSPGPDAAPASDWAAEPAIGGSRFVYAPHVLWRSARVLFAAGMISVPDGVRALVEGVYGEGAEDVPAALQAAAIKTEGITYARQGAARFNLLDFRKGYILTSGPWDSDTAIPTRDGDVYTTFRMVRVQDGRLVPWCEDADPRKAWASSEVTLRRSIAEGESVPPRYAEMVSELQRSWKKWERETPVLVLEAGANTWTAEAISKKTMVKLNYDPTNGLRVLPVDLASSAVSISLIQ